eukprot:363941-Chlamydomonas_euryale.AAC.24
MHARTAHGVGNQRAAVAAVAACGVPAAHVAAGTEEGVAGCGIAAGLQSRMGCGVRVVFGWCVAP